jgi:hypothetical protein
MKNLFENFFQDPFFITINNRHSREKPTQVENGKNLCLFKRIVFYREIFIKLSIQTDIDDTFFNFFAFLLVRLMEIESSSFFM